MTKVSGAKKINAYIADLETNGFLDVVTTVHCGVFISLEGDEVVSFSPEDGIDYIPRMLSFMDKCDTLIFHNGFGYDFPVLEKLFNYEYKGKKEDTLVLSRLLNPKRLVPPNCPNKKAPHSIEAWGYRVGRGKPEHTEWEVFTPGMLHRCKEDVEIGKLTYLALQQEKQDYEWDPAIRLSNRLFEILGKQEQYGWLVDQEWIEKSLSMLTHWMDRIDKALYSYLPIILEVQETKDKGEYKYVKKPFLKSKKYNKHVMNWLEDVGWNPEDRIIGGPHTRVNFRKVDLDKSAEVKDWLLKLGWIPDKWNYSKKTGERTSPKLDKDDDFIGITSGLGRLVARRVQCKSRRSIVEGWKGVIRPDGRIPSVVANLAETGRATHRNIVNVPNGEAFFGKWMRKMFICKPGYKLVGTDSAGCQLRMLAARMGDKDYMETIVNGDKDKGTDMHTVNMEAAGLGTRGQAKTFIYGFLFGGGDAKIGSIVGGGAEDGKRLKEQFLNGLPALGALIERLTKEWRSNAKKRPNKWGGMEYYNGYVIGLDGRPIFIDSEHKILVYVLQSDEAVMMAAAYNILYKRCKQKGWKWGVDWAYVCWYHDEVQIECREEIAQEIGKMSEQAIVDAGKFYNIKCPHEGEAQIGNSWHETH